MVKLFKNSMSQYFFNSRIFMLLVLLLYDSLLLCTHIIFVFRKSFAKTNFVYFQYCKKIDPLRIIIVVFVNICNIRMKYFQFFYISNNSRISTHL